MIRTNSSFEVSNIDLYKNQPIIKTICIVQTSQEMAALVFPRLSISEENLQFLEKRLFS